MSKKTNSNFIELNDLPVYDNLLEHLDNNLMHYLQTEGQICINTVPGHEDDFLFGSGSLKNDWSKKNITTENEMIVLNVPEKTKRYHEKDFTIICNRFKNTPFQKIYEEIKNKYSFVGRVRIFYSNPVTCLSWHNDYCKRIHYPIKTQEGCIMIIDDEVAHLKQHTWYETDTSKMHTAVNASRENRIHLVAVVE